MLGLEKIDEDPHSVFDREWDNLIILDGCRHDLYEEVRGDTDYRFSLGSSSPDFIENNFSEGNFSDVVYVTGNPFFSEKKFSNFTGRNPDQVFHEVFHTYDTDWNQEKGTVLPGPLLRDAKTARKLFPDKRIVVHLMQPHYPFVGGETVSTGMDFRNSLNGESVWDLASRGEGPGDEQIWKEYRENLEFVLDKVIESLDDVFEGKTVLTSDHGNLVGEKGLYGHSFDLPAVQLRKVPWDTLMEE